MRKTVQRIFVIKFIEKQTVPKYLRTRTKRSTGRVWLDQIKKILETKLSVNETHKMS
jgi:hypothetical protein